MSLYRDGGERPKWISSRRRLEWPNGACAQVFSAEDPDSLRGPQFAAAWLDELAKWRHADETFNMLQFGLAPWRAAAAGDHHHAAADRADQAADARIASPSCRARQPTRTRRIWRPAFLDLDHRALRRHAARPPGNFRRDHRGARRRVVVARDDRAMPCRRRAGAGAHRRRGRSAGVGDKARRCLRHRRGGRRRERRRLCARRRDGGGPVADRLGGEGDRAVAQAFRRRAGRRGQPGRRHGEDRDRGGRPQTCR